MRKIIEFLTVVFLWVAGLSLSAHMLLPHDHHISDSYSHQNESCPVSDENSGHKPAFPAHCQAFNDLTSEKARLVNIAQNPTNDLVAIRTFPVMNTSVLQTFSERIVCLQIPVFDSHTYESALLRGPPALS
jgi:hypothetical protein